MGGVTTGMIPGIDPQVDIAFKKVFGSQEFASLDQGADRCGHPAERETRQELAHRVRLCERLLRRSLTDTTELLQRDALVLRELANDLERRLTRQ